MRAQVFPNFDTEQYFNLIRPQEQKADYIQTWLEGDIPKWQIFTNFGPVQMNVIDCNGNQLEASHSFTIKTVTPTLLQPGWNCYELAIPQPVSRGRFFFQLSVGSDEAQELYISEPQQVTNYIPNSISSLYQNTVNHGGIIFETGITFQFRTEGGISRLAPKAFRTTWVDQPYNTETINAIPYREWKLTIGDGRGVPDWVSDKMNHVFCCDTVQVNGVEYTLPDNAEWSPATEDDYPMSGWSTTVRQTKNMDGLYTENNNALADKIFVTMNLDTALFGNVPGNVNNDPIQITEIS